MKLLDQFIDVIRNAIKALMSALAITLNKATGGKLSADVITLIGLFSHIPIAWLIAIQKNYLAAGLLVFFGLFDSVDGALARAQKKSSSRGMLLDASTDRIKEVILYIGASSALVASGYAGWAGWAVAACGASLVVSYVKAKGETAISDKKLSPSDINRIFADGIMRFEIRMFVLIVGLLTNTLRYALVFIAVTSALTAIGRFHKISQKL
ncbi:MAG: CDP-alcohol phosphatidyltransferase family protein [Candidatus Saccharibacteria bacterium]|nr:CDP-alcohol phosphatidyltransferase family protein [Candidatus Saccharibacteria bacterium]